MMSEKKLFLLDAMALIYRAYFALNKNPRITSKGVNTSAFLGFANALLDILRKEKPSHIGVAFDTMAPTSRHLEFTDYKANREKMPEDIAVCIPYIKQLLQVLRIPVLYADGYEADDVVGTLSKQAEREGFKVFMVTPDKDFGQLVSSNIFIYKPARMGSGVEILGPAEVCAKFGVENQLQVIDMLGLWGDASDNIPGIPGVGEVTARKLIAQFGSVENMIKNVDQIENPKLREKVRTHSAQALESKMLATIILDAPVTFNEEELLIGKPDVKALSALLDELEMRSLAARIYAYFGISVSDIRPLVQSPVRVSADDTGSDSTSGMDTEAIRNEDTVVHGKPGKNGDEGRKPGIADVMPDMFAPENMPESKPLLCADPVLEKVCVWPDEGELEKGLTSLLSSGKRIAFCLLPIDEGNVRHTSLSLLSFALFDSHGPDIETGLFAYIPSAVRRKDDFHTSLVGSTGWNEQEKECLVEFFREGSTSRLLACYDLKNQLHYLMNLGYEEDVLASDLMLAHYLMEPESSHDLQRLVMNYLPNDFQRRKSQVTHRSDSGLEDMEYGLQVVLAVARLLPGFEQELREDSMMELFHDVEIPLSNVLCRMEREGVCIDTVRLKEYAAELRTQIAEVEERVYSYAGEKFNLSSPRQLGDVLYEKLKITEKPKTTRTKQYSTAEDVLIKLQHKHPIVGDVLQYRSLTKLLSTYVEALPLLVDSSTGRIHTTYNQAVTATGRLSSQNPNLQNIPVRSELGKEIRRCFIPSAPDHYILSADYSQIELRIIAHLSGDVNMLADFSGHKDVHTATAAHVFNVDPQDVDPDMRRKAKMVNFGIIYGISAFGLAERLQISRKEAAALIERYFEHYPGLKEYTGRVVAEAREKGYVETILHRRRYLKDITSANAVVRSYAERNAVNAPIQGSSADMIKVAMVRVDHELRKRKLGARMLMQVHDELVLDVPANEVETVSALVVDIMRNSVVLQVPLEVEARYASNWLDAH